MLWTSIDQCNLQSEIRTQLRASSTDQSEMSEVNFQAMAIGEERTSWGTDFQLYFCCILKDKFFTNNWQKVKEEYQGCIDQKTQYIVLNLYKSI